MLNHIHLVGYVGNPPEFHITQEGKKVLTFSLATYKSWQKEDGTWQKHIDWHRVTVFKKSLHSLVGDDLKRGSLVYVQGELAYSKREDRITPYILVANSASKILHLKDGKTEQERMVEELISEAQVFNPENEEEHMNLPHFSSQQE
jgi:single stranded DNA-binding protein